MVKKIRKLIDIDTNNDLPALAALAARRKQSLKKMIEDFLHQLAISAMKDELKRFVDNAEKKEHEREKDKEF